MPSMMNDTHKRGQAEGMVTLSTSIKTKHNLTTEYSKKLIFICYLSNVSTQIVSLGPPKNFLNIRLLVTKENVGISRKQLGLLDQSMSTTFEFRACHIAIILTPCCCRPAEKESLETRLMSHLYLSHTHTPI